MEQPHVEIGPGPAKLRELILHAVELGGWSVGEGGRVLIRLAGTQTRRRCDQTIVVGLVPGPGIDLVLPSDTEALIGLVDHLLAGHPCPVIEVRAWQRGIASDWIAAGLAWQLAKESVTTLVDTGPDSVGMAALLDVSPIGETDCGEAGQPLGTFAASGLPTWGKVRVCAPKLPFTRETSESIVGALSRDSCWVVAHSGYGPQLQAASIKVAVTAGTAESRWHMDHDTIAPDVIVATTPAALQLSRKAIMVGGMRAAARGINLGFGPRPTGRFGFGIRKIARLVRTCQAS